MVSQGPAVIRSPAMRPGARTPEELETLFEDAVTVRDGDAIAELFEDGAVLVLADAAREARGAGEIARVASESWPHDLAYLADPWRVLQARDTALVVAQHAINVVRRGEEGTWRYAISLLRCDDRERGQQTKDRRTMT